VLNALAAAALALGVDAPLDAIRDGLAAARAVAGRLVTHHLSNGVVLIDDSYNANPGSLNAAIDTLAAASTSSTAGESWLVLGDMRELGDDEVALHAEAGRRAKSAGIARLYAFGPLSAAAVQAFGAGAEHFDSHAALADALRAALKPDVRVLVKGSRGSAMDRVAKALLNGEAAHAA
jgi:UDP-N-acetylmuramoyl-tripeptide--D-alanyl-D-alanine ligase